MKVVALAFPGNSFCSDWVFHWSKLLFYCWSKRIGTIICPAIANSSHIARNYTVIEAEGNGTPYDYYLTVDSDQTEVHEAFQELYLTMELRPEIDMLAAWTWIDGEGAVINAGRFLRDTEDNLIKDENGIYAYENISYKEIEEASDPIEVDWVGFGCVLIRRKVIQGIGPGLFDALYKSKDGVVSWMSDDEGFCLRALDKGFRIFIHPEVYVPHLKLRPLEPRKEKQIDDCINSSKEYANL